MSSAPDRYQLVVRDLIRETDSACTVVFDIPPGAEGEFAYRPGQFLTLQLPGPDGPIARCYSLCSSPHVDGAMLKVSVKRVRDGLGSNWINDNLRRGQTVESLTPAGVFTPRSFDEDLLLFAGGSGITPVMSILQSALSVGSGRVVLVYANQCEDAVIFAVNLRLLAERYPERLLVIHWLESLQGLPTSAQLAALAAPFISYSCFICGPGPFMDSVAHALRGFDIPAARVHIERFQSLSANPFAALPATSGEQSSGQAATLHVELDGHSHTLSWPSEMKLLDLLLSEGIDAPFSCREGACSACACVVTVGAVSMLANDILGADELDRGLVLACQARPASATVSIRYEL